jgi:hypothetical protein
MTLEIRILHPGDAGELFRLRRSALLDSPLAFLASPEDDPASSEEAVRELLDPRRASVVLGAYNPGLVGMLSRYKFDYAAHDSPWSARRHSDCQSHAIQAGG